MLQLPQINKVHRKDPLTLNRYDTDDLRWLAVQQRNPNADGHFVYSVATTGVYCRPACPSRLALRENIAFHDTCTDAERAGFRPCKRCQPTGASLAKRHADAAAKACRIIETSDPLPSLDELANAVGLSRYHFHRIFKKTVGVTPRQYFAAHRNERVRSELRSQPSVTQAIYGAGFNSSSRFYERSTETLGMTPGEYQKGGNGTVIRYGFAACPLGLALIAGTARGICSVSFGINRALLEEDLRKNFPKASFEKADRSFDTWVKAIVDHIKDPASRVDLPLDIRGTAFQQRVWQALREIPVGQTASYTEVAARIGQPSAVRAVARACATNRIAAIIPCHRVIGTNGSLTGYRWGVERKRQLLKQEHAVTKNQKK
ncbi:bifunctional DNA-binding transcriptional regulator/O6-methylguanine-DNA methyltransferase Ada [Pedosphaera parvula]|nr:bifunctional DNA-binding transcriptional regulator/O6-methylguanine-DNA methyltransferase Ada [Pedosphaera parvula]